VEENKTCPYCGSRNSIAKGYRYNRSGKVPLRRCKECGRRWTVNGDPVDIGGPDAVSEAAAPTPVPPAGTAEDADSDVVPPDSTADAGASWAS